MRICLVWNILLKRLPSKMFPSTFFVHCLLYASTALLLEGQLGVERGTVSALPPLWTGLKQFLCFLEHGACKSAHLLSRLYTRGWGRFWAIVRDWKNLDNHNEKFSLINVVERVEKLGCNEEISCVGRPSREVCATLKMKPWWQHLPLQAFSLAEGFFVGWWWIINNAVEKGLFWLCFIARIALL